MAVEIDADRGAQTPGMTRLAAQAGALDSSPKTMDRQPRLISLGNRACRSRGPGGCRA